MGASLVAFAIIAPWLVWIPVVSAPATVVVTGAVAILGALHGWGRLVARAAGREDVDAALALQWGIAAVLGVAGILLALRIYDPRFLLIAGAVAHSADLALRFTTAREAIGPLLAWRRVRFWIFPAVLLVAFALVNILGAAGQVTARPFDDETNVIAQIHRVATTGALADDIGYARTNQLGGHVTLGALAQAFGDAHLGRMVDRGIGLALFLVLLCSRLRPRDAGSAIWSSLLVVVAASFTVKTADLLPLWIPAGLLLGLHLTVATSTMTPRAMLPIGLLAGALWVVRTEHAPIGIALVVLTWWTGRQRAQQDLRRAAVVVGGLAGVVVAYYLARAMGDSAADTHALLTRRALPLVARLALFVVVLGALAPLLLFAVREVDQGPVRWFALAATAGVAGIASRLVGTAPASLQLLWPIALAGVAVLAIALAAEATLRRAALVLGALACILVHEAQTAPRRSAWSWRNYALLFDVQAARHPLPHARPYDDLLARVPAGERVAVWVSRPEQLDYTRHDIIDLRTPLAARSKKLEKLLTASRARWLLLDPENRSSFAKVLAQSRVVANTQGVRLLALW